MPQLTWGQLFGLLFMTMEPDRAISAFSRVGDDDSAPEVRALAWRSAAKAWSDCSESEMGRNRRRSLLRNVGRPVPAAEPSWGFPVYTGLRRVLVMSLVVATFFGTESLAQTVSGADANLARPIESVTVIIANPSPDAGLNARVVDRVRREIGLFPGDRFSKPRMEVELVKARRISDVGDVDYDLAFGSQGGLDVTVTVTLADGVAKGRGLAFGGDFPVIYEKDGTYLRFKLDALALYFGNHNAWYGDPESMLAGNPLAQGQASGAGWGNWVEGYVTYGIYGITPLSKSLYVYGGLSAITSGSAGQELFTDETRSFTGVEDAYVGFVGGRTDDEGNRLSLNISAGRQRFTLANGFLLASTAANGGERGALQANARWSADFLGLAQLRYDSTLIEAFYVDPDELPILDTGTAFAGLNVEFVPVENLQTGLSYITAPQSDFNYFGPTGAIVGTREGLRVWDARSTYTPNGLGLPGPYFGGEFARQTNENFDMDARAGWAEVGYSTPAAPWSPTFSYRYSHFTGDDPDTATFERWDPLLSGLDGEAWIQGANHVKVVQTSNVIAHRLQARLRPSPKVELIPQIWAFHADSKTNVGGNPALGFLEDDEYGFEAIVTAKWFVNRNTYVHGHISHTWPGKAVKQALDDPDNWLSAMLFVRYSF